MTVKIFSYGGGVQSTAALVLAAQGKLDYRTFVFCNVGADSENPATLAYYVHQAIPFAQAHGLELIEINRRHKATGEIVTLYQRLTKPSSRTIGIPAYMENGAPGRRSCTADFKIRLLDQWLKQQRGIKALLDKEQRYRRMLQAIDRHLNSMPRSGAATLATALTTALYKEILHPRPLAIVGLGISLDEFHRARTESGVEWKQLHYPLIDLRLTRQDCTQIILDAGLPMPESSSCWFCPFHTKAKWTEMHEKKPALFAQAAALEDILNDRRARLKKDEIFLYHKLIPLRELAHALDEQVRADSSCPSDDPTEEQQFCESGYCLT